MSVRPAITASILFPAFNAEIRLSNGISIISSLRFIFSAIFLIKSMSNPTMSPFSSIYSNGLKVAFVPIVKVPFFNVLISFSFALCGNKNKNMESKMLKKRINFLIIFLFILKPP